MYNLLNLQRKIAPEVSDLVELRYNLLRQISLNQPIGRRMLVAKTGLSERNLRSQVDFLKDNGLVDFSKTGMNITDEGCYLLERLNDYVKELKGIFDLEKTLAKELKVEKVIIIPGDSDQDELTFHNLGQMGAKVLQDFILAGSKNIAISGGSTMRMLADSVNYQKNDALVVPARGGLGDNAKQQANAIAVVLANRLDAHYRQIYIPDNISGKTLAVLLEEDQTLNQVVDIMRNADVLIHGIGNAENMAKRRGTLQTALVDFEKTGAVGEALGKYYTILGKEVYLNKSKTVLLKDFSKIGKVITVAGGGNKAKAILAVCRSGGIDVLVLDWSAANAIRKFL